MEATGPGAVCEGFRVLSLEFFAALPVMTKRRVSRASKQGW
jgi:hypothetical protein